jgi:predicted nucleic acid-binding protein
MRDNFSGKVIISDTSCLIALTNIEALNVLKDVCGEVVITPTVLSEFGEKLPDWITVKDVADKSRIELIETQLDPGESSSIALAFETENPFLILDDGAAREYAEQLNLQFTGTLGLLIAAREKNIIPNLHAVVEKLKKKEFRLPKNVDEIVNQAEPEAD